MKSKKSVSKSQRRLFGWAYACSKGKSKNCPDTVRNVGNVFKDKYPEDFESMAKTKHKGLPDRVSKSKKKSKIKRESFSHLKTFEEYYSESDYNCPECGSDEIVIGDSDR